MRSHEANWRETEAASYGAVRPRRKKGAKEDSAPIGEVRRPAIAEFRVRGTVRFFNPQKGYGFVRPEGEGQKDAFLHVSALKAITCSEIAEGATVECYATPTSQNPRVVRVVSVDMSTATGAVQKLIHESEWTPVTLKRPTKDGFIFGAQENGPDVFIHFKVMDRSRIPRDEFVEGRVVEVKYIERMQGLAAVAAR